MLEHSNNRASQVKPKIFISLFTLLRIYKAYLKKVFSEVLRSLPITSEKIGSPKGFHKTTFDWILLNKLQENYKEVYPSHWIYRLEPKTIDRTIDWRFFAGALGSELKTPSAFVALIPNGRVWGNSGAVISPDDKLLADVSIEFGVMPDNAEKHSVFRKLKLPKLSKINEALAILTAVGGTGYFHWMFDVLPRIHLLRCSGIYDEVSKFLVNEIIFSYQEETLNILGIPKEKLITTDAQFHAKAQKLIVPALPGITGSMPKWACDFLRQEFLLNKTTDSQDRPERIYISRANANSRRIGNENELIEFLIGLDFKIYTLENLSIIEQASIFNSAKFIVAPHGAGLTNLVFCNPESKVIELFSPTYVNPCYRALSNMIGVEYWYLLGEGQTPPESVADHLINSAREGFKVNIDLLEKILKLSSIDAF
jgi:capsular polysaccharide biosynthesis protein